MEVLNLVAYVNVLLHSTLFWVLLVVALLGALKLIDLLIVPHRYRYVRHGTGGAKDTEVPSGIRDPWTVASFVVLVLFMLWVLTSTVA